MTTKIVFPFVAIVGQDDVKQALLIALINPKVGGVLVAGEKGTGKSSLVRALNSVIANTKIVDLPLNATEDMVFGNMNLEYAVKHGKKLFSPGILARAYDCVLYVDEINLLRRELLTGILDAADRGENIVEREGISNRHAVKFTLIGTMNPEEGTLTAPVLDRFGLFVTVSRETEPAVRTEILRRVLAYEKDPEAFVKAYRDETQELTSRLQTARNLIGAIEAGTAMIELAARYADKAQTAGHRAEIFLIETAKAVAALAGRKYMLPADMEKAALFVLPHRIRKEITPQPEPEQEQARERQEQQDNYDEQSNPPSQPSRNAPAPDNKSRPGDTKDCGKDLPQQNDNIGQDRIVGIDKSFPNINLSLSLPQDRQVRHGGGKRSITRTNLHQGRYVRSCLPNGRMTDLAFDATIRAAAPYQQIRKKGKCCMTILNEDLRQKVREKKIGNTFLFVVDASGSMGARERMHAVKGAIFSMLKDAYQKRDQVGLIAFRRQTAEVLLPVTRSVDLAQKCLQQLPTGGKTPLAEGLSSAFSVLKSMRKKEQEMKPVILLITDGRANRSTTDGGDAVDDVLKMARKIQASGCPSVVIDTENDFIKLGIARTVAREMGAAYYRLKELSDQKILHIINNFQ